MSKATDFLAGVKVLEKVESPINGKLTVMKDLAWGTYIQGAGITQSGGVAISVWKTALKKVKGKRQEVKDCLVLGLGGGGIVKIIKKYWPDAKITGVDIDPVIVELGKKYLGLDEFNVEIKIQDAYEFLTTHNSLPTPTYDLICIDIYVGDKVPDKFESDKFLELVLELITPSGIAVFNRLYYDEKRKEAEIFHRKLIHTFRKVRPIYPQANVMYLCSI